MSVVTTLTASCPYPEESADAQRWREYSAGNARTSHTDGFPMSHQVNYGWVGWHPGSWMLCSFYSDMSFWIYSSFSLLLVHIFTVQLLPANAANGTCLLMGVVGVVVEINA